MLVVLANDPPPAVRDRMKLWFVEPRPNAFVSSIKDSVAVTVADYLYRHCPPESGLLMFRSLSAAPGYQIITTGIPCKPITILSGLQLVIETLQTPETVDVVGL
ncbi:MAG: type I-E CRISPR-associated endoribonuclease Cas2e [Zoogloeaceae bacterium]|jgi:CRISPR-associated protein Cas2|nr:type I-E CRISPR-associated endoribonuclease Cas2e [Zoogloeaceae bacterium]